MYRITQRNIPKHSDPLHTVLWEDAEDSFNRKYYHNKGEPSVILEDGTKIYCFWGFIHREDGPAIEYPDGRKSYFIVGDKVSEAEYSWEIFLREP